MRAPWKLLSFVLVAAIAQSAVAACALADETRFVTPPAKSGTVKRPTLHDIREAELAKRKAKLHHPAHGSKTRVIEAKHEVIDAEDDDESDADE